VKVVWSRRALLDVEHIRDYIAQDSPAYAQPFIERLLYTTRNLASFPLSGRPMPEADNPNIREVIYQGYRIIYRIGSGNIEIAMVVHGSRDLSQFDGR
jgi:plasmid stabilization system protein ParE